MNTQASLLDAIDERDRGIKRAVDHAERHIPNWSLIALGFVIAYAKTHETFSGEDVRIASDGFVPEPEHLRAWGGVMLAAAKQKFIERIGYVQVKTASSHAATATLWRSRLI